MKLLLKLFTICTLLVPTTPTWGNQTTDLSPVLTEAGLPFSLQIDVANFALPTGIQSFATATSGGLWLLIAGRTNGLHGFNNVGNNFPPALQNTVVYVVDPYTGTSWSRSLYDSTSGLTQAEIDALSVVASEAFQKGNSLYFIGGYGINTTTGQMETKSTLTTIDISKMMQWVRYGTPSAKSAIRQTSHPALQVTGGALFQANDHQPLLLILGQNFAGLYNGNSNGQYTMQIRPFTVNDNPKRLSVLAKPLTTTLPDYRRRDLNVVPILQNNRFAFLALGGVFTLDTGVWTVPITIFPDGSSVEADPTSPDTFKQAMNHYNCPAFGIYSTNSQEMFVVLPGGISFGYFSGGVFTTDPNIPFINQVTTVKIDKNNRFTQHLMNQQFPFIASTGSHPGNELLFGAEAAFIPKDGIALYSNGVIQLDALPKQPTVIGYILGGIMSTLAETVVDSDSTASPYVFTVTLVPK